MSNDPTNQPADASPSDGDRVLRLEETVLHLDHSSEQMGEQVVALQKRVLALTQRLSMLESRLEMLANSASAPAPPSREEEIDDGDEHRLPGH